MSRHRLSLTAGSARAEVEASDSVVHALLVGLYQEFLNATVGEPSISAKVLQSKAGEFHWTVGADSGKSSNRTGALLDFEATLCRALLEANREDYLGLHAATIWRDGKLALLFGPSGAGKSTTAVALACRGFRVGSDDATLLGIDTGELIPLPRPFHLESTPFSMELPPNWRDHAFLTPNDFPSREPRPAHPSVLVCLRPTRGVRANVRPTTTAEILALLLSETAVSTRREDEIISRLATLAASSRGFVVDPGTVENTAETIERLILDSAS